METEQLRQHPAYGCLVDYYRMALVLWRLHCGDARTSPVFGLTRREYCDRYIELNLPPLASVGSSTGDQTSLLPADCDAAYHEAVGST